jgi:hypothetical protein
MDRMPHRQDRNPEATRQLALRRQRLTRFELPFQDGLHERLEHFVRHPMPSEGLDAGRTDAKIARAAV